MKRLVLAPLAAVAACVPTSTTSTGPNLSVTVTTTDQAQQVNDTTPDAVITLDTNPSYMLDVDVTSIAGTTNGADDAVKTLTASFTAPGQTIADSPFDVVDPTAAPNLEYKRASPVTLPASAKGSMLEVKIDGVDGAGLHSNVIDFKISLQ